MQTTLRQSLVAMAVVACATTGIFGALAATSEAASSEAATGSRHVAATLPSSQVDDRIQDIASGGVSPANQCLKSHVASVEHSVHEAGKPLLVVVGASITAGVGATCPTAAWPYLLAQQMGWRLALRGVSGAGYAQKVRTGGPFLNELVGLHVLSKSPSVVILQGGHNDVGQSTASLERHVTATVGMVRHDAPHAKLVLLTVFSGGRPTRAQLRADAAIVSTARKSDPQVLIIDPIAQHWVYGTIKDHLHPTDAGYRWIANRMDHALRAGGITAGKGP